MLWILYFSFIIHIAAPNDFQNIISNSRHSLTNRTHVLNSGNTRRNKAHGKLYDILENIDYPKVYDNIDDNKQINSKEERIKMTTLNRLIDWLKNILKRNPSTTVTPALESSRNIIQDLVEIQSGLFDVIAKLNNKLEHFTPKPEEITLPPLYQTEHYSKVARYKREVDQVNITEETSKHNVKKPLNITINNNANITEETTESGVKILNGRRSLNRMDIDSPSEVKTKLVKYLEDTYKDIMHKIEPLSQIKKEYSNSNVYTIGYIVANIDTLEVNLNNIKKDMDINKHLWSDRIILGMFDKLMLTNRIVSNLLESLDVYSQKHKKEMFPGSGLGVGLVDSNKV